MTKKIFSTKSHSTEDLGLITIIGLLTILKDLSFPQELKLAENLRVFLVSKYHYHPRKIQFDVLDDPKLKANIEAKQDRFQLDRYRPLAFQHGSLLYNAWDHEWIPNATDNSWDSCSGQNPEHEYHFIQTLGWSLKLTNITLSFDVKSESI